MKKIAPQAKFLKQNFWNNWAAAYMCTPAASMSQMCTLLLKTHLYTCTPAHAMVPRTPVHKCMQHKLQKKAHICIQTHICTRIHKRMNTHVQSWHHPNTPQNSYWDQNLCTNTHTHTDTCYTCMCTNLIGTPSIQDARNCILAVHELVKSKVLSGSELIFTEITRYKYFSLI